MMMLSNSTSIQQQKCNVTVRLFKDTGEELSEAPIVLSVDTQTNQLEQLYYKLLKTKSKEEEFPENERSPIQFRIRAEDVDQEQQAKWIEIINSFIELLPNQKLFGEKALELFCLPQAVFRVRPITRCTASLLGHVEPVISVQFNPDGNYLASGSGDKTVRLWDLQTQLPLKTLEGHQHWVLCIAWSPDGIKLASACKQGTIIIWDVQSGFQMCRKLIGHKQWINALCWQPLHLQSNSRLLASAGKDCTIRIWDIITYTTLRVLSGHTASVTAIRWGGSGLIYSGSHDRTIRVWRADDGVLCRILTGHAHWINTLALNVDYVLRVGFYSVESQYKGESILNPCTNPEEARQFAKKRYEKALNGQPERLVSGSDDFTMYLWEPADKKQHIARLTGHQQLINHVQFSPDTRLIASASFDKSIKLWDGYSGKFLTSLRGHVAPVYQIAWSADSRLLVSGSADSTLKVWNAQKTKLALDLPGHGDEVFAVDWSPSGEHVASGGKDKVLKLWRR